MKTNTNNVLRPPSLLETEHLLLRAPRLEDALDLCALAEEDPVFARETIGEETNSLEANCTAIIRMILERLDGRGAWWIVEEKATARIIGLTGFSRRARSAGFINALATGVVGRGFAAETIAALGGHHQIRRSPPSTRSTSTAMLFRVQPQL